MILYHIMLRFSMMYRLCDMIYGLRRMIYLLRKHDIISVPLIRNAYIICKADIIASAISSVPQGTDIIVKNLFCQVDKRGFLHGAGGGGRTRTRSLGLDFESSTSANSITPANYRLKYSTTYQNKNQDLFEEKQIFFCE